RPAAGPAPRSHVRTPPLNSIDFRTLIIPDGGPQPEPHHRHPGPSGAGAAAAEPPTDGRTTTPAQAGERIVRLGLWAGVRDNECYKVAQLQRRLLNVCSRRGAAGENKNGGGNCPNNPWPNQHECP